MHGYRVAMEAERMPIPASYVRHGEFTYRSGLQGAAALLDLAEPPTTIFAGNDEIALGVIETARTRGRHIPEDLSIVGVNDTLLARMASPSLTAMRQPLRERGTIALRTALRLANGEKTQLVVRDSTAPPGHAGRR
jgi:LacI family transcriptional regulator